MLALVYLFQQVGDRCNLPKRSSPHERGEAPFILFAEQWVIYEKKTACRWEEQMKVSFRFWLDFVIWSLSWKMACLVFVLHSWHTERLLTLAQVFLQLGDFSLSCQLVYWKSWRGETQHPAIKVINRPLSANRIAQSTDIPRHFSCKSNKLTKSSLLLWI